MNVKVLVGILIAAFITLICCICSLFLISSILFSDFNSNNQDIENYDFPYSINEDNLKLDIFENVGAMGEYENTDSDVVKEDAITVIFAEEVEDLESDFGVLRVARNESKDYTKEGLEDACVITEEGSEDNRYYYLATCDAKEITGYIDGTLYVYVYGIEEGYHIFIGVHDSEDLLETFVDEFNDL